MRGQNGLPAFPRAISEKWTIAHECRLDLHRKGVFFCMKHQNRWTLNVTERGKKDPESHISLAAALETMDRMPSCLDHCDVV